ncbi:hypothetical protein [Streptomyces sp. NPDC002176]
MSARAGRAARVTEWSGWPCDWALPSGRGLEERPGLDERLG